MSTLTLPVLEAVDKIIAKIRTEWKELPELVVVLGQPGATRSGQTHGHFAPNSWTKADDTKPELHEMMLSGESLKRGSEATLGTIIHECVHAYAHVKEITDTSNNGRYHNQKFKKLAEDFGLEIEKGDTIGWSITTVPTATVAKYAPEVAELETALQAYRVVRTKLAGPVGKKFKMQCYQCEDPILTTKKWFERHGHNLYCQEHEDYFEMFEEGG